ncbi:mucin-2-like [Centroberyx affinis]|uniref:mucin-2-like n=1 Tax=Centroberyx affinis TaxID=166261 RepID=UPI003A5C0BF7
MGLFTVTNLLLVTLLVQPTEALTESPVTEWDSNTTPEPVNDERFREFCLQIPDESHWTSSEPVHQPTRRATEPTSRATEPTTQATQPERQATQSTPPQIVRRIDNVLQPLNFIGFDPSTKKPKRGCRCKTLEMKLPTESSKVRKITARLPDKRCKMTEIIETLMDGREVCVNASSILSHLDSTFLRPPVTTTETPTAPWDPTTELTTTTPPPVTETPDEEGSGELWVDFISHHSHVETKVVEESYSCLGCLMMNWDEIDRKSVASLDMTLPHVGCPVIIFVNLKDGKSMCVDSGQLGFRTALEKLDIQAH